MKRGRRLGDHAAAATEAILALLADGSVWPTGDLAEATGYRYSNAAYTCLTRLHRLGHVGRYRQPDLYSAYWQWWPSEGTCDTVATTVPAAPRCCDDAPFRCWSCQSWARCNLPARTQVRS